MYPHGLRGRGPLKVRLGLCTAVWLYSEVLTELLDRHCPAVKVRRKAKEKTPWYDADCRAARRQARAAERRFRRSHREDDRLTWMGLLRSMRALYEDKNTSF